MDRGGEVGAAGDSGLDSSIHKRVLFKCVANNCPHLETCLLHVSEWVITNRDVFFCMRISSSTLETCLSFTY